MQWELLIAIVRPGLLERVERRLRDCGVKGISVTAVKGYGECADFFRRDRLVPHARIEIFTERGHASGIAEEIMSAAHTGGQGDGIVAILPVGQIFRIRERCPCKPGEI